MKNFNLFGGENEILEAPKSFTQLSKYQKFKAMNHYRKAEGEKKCGNCASHLGGGYHDKQYHKCKLIGLSHSMATDIRVGHVCDLHKEE